MHLGGTIRSVFPEANNAKFWRLVLSLNDGLLSFSESLFVAHIEDELLTGQFF